MHTSNHTMFNMVSSSTCNIFLKTVFTYIACEVYLLIMGHF